MSSLEVLLSFPSQRKALLSALGLVETCNLGAIIFYPTDLKPHLPYHVAFQIVVAYTTKYFTWNIFCTVIDEGASNCVMSLVCWKALANLVCLRHLRCLQCLTISHLDHMESFLPSPCIWEEKTCVSKLKWSMHLSTTTCC
jgi:hypothetical protein